MKSKISQALVERAPTPERGRSILHADTELRGFYLILTPTKRSFYVQSLVNGRQVRAKLGDHPAMSAKDARDLARKTLVGMRAGANPMEERRKARSRGITLRQALELHLAARPLSDRTVQDYRYYCDHYLSDWLDRALADIGADRQAVRERHVRISKKNGTTTADSTYRILRAVYNRGLREHPDLPSNPTGNVDFHGQKRRKVDANADKLTSWGKAVLTLSPLRRDMHLFFLLTGMRRTAGITSKSVDLNLVSRVLHVPKPKGGVARRFDLPLSAALEDLLSHRVVENGKEFRGTPWLFPSNSRSGHVAEVKQPELGDLTGHALRHTYATLALEAGVPIAELKFLLNHAPDSVTMGYLHPSIDHLRIHQEKVSAYVLRKLGLVHQPGTWPPTLAETTSGLHQATLTVVGGLGPDAVQLLAA
jgi:integrase